MFTYIPTDKELVGEISENGSEEKVQDPTVIDSKTVYINDSFILDTIPLNVDEIIDTDDEEDII